MEFKTVNDNKEQEVQSSVIQRDKQECLASATLTSHTLSQLNATIENLPQRCQQLLQEVTRAQFLMGVAQLDPVAVSLYHTRQLSASLDEDYEILTLQQKNAELQRRIDGNKKFLEDLRRELEWSKGALANQSPGPGDIQDYVRNVKEKVVFYEECCDKAKAKLAKLSIPDAIMPKSLTAMVSDLRILNEEAGSLRQRADDVTLARDAAEKLNRLFSGYQ